MALRQESTSSFVQALSPAVGSSVTGPLLHEPYEDDDLDEFEDATEDRTNVSVDLHIAFTDCEVAIRYFFNNDLIEAMNIMKPWCRTSLYHSLGMSIFEFIPGVLTFDPQKISQALAVFKTCINVCNQNRRNYTFVETLGTIIRRPDYRSYTDLEAHAELCYAEVLLLQALTTIMAGEDLTGLIKGTLKIKNCYNSYKDCAKILEQKEWETEESKLHFHSGVRLGIATFNVFISLLPPKIVSVLEFVGFSGDKRLGLVELEAGSRAAGLRAVLCDLTLLGYHLVICHFIGAPPNLPVCREILHKQLKIYPNGVWFLVFKGRYEFMQGQFEPSIVTYNRAINSQNTWPQFRHLCYWEIMWVNGLLMNWREAASYANRLLEESSWSKTIYCYTKAALLLQLGDDRNMQEIQQCAQLMRNACYYKQRIAGKSLPMEKFMIRRCGRFEAQGRRLLLPAVELLCLWNMFPILAKHERAAQALLKVIEKTVESMESGRECWRGATAAAGAAGAGAGAGVGAGVGDPPLAADNAALARYLHGCLLAAMGLPRMALSTFQTLLRLKNDIKEDTFLLPYTLTEMAMCEYQLGDRDRAIHMLNDARKKYSGYALESRLHFRIHSKIQIIKSNTNTESTN